MVYFNYGGWVDLIQEHCLTVNFHFPCLQDMLSRLRRLVGLQFRRVINKLSHFNFQLFGYKNGYNCYTTSFFSFNGINLFENLVSRELQRILQNFHFSISKHFDFTFHFSKKNMVRVKKWMFFLGPKCQFLAIKSDFWHTTPILVNGPFVALREAVHFSPWEGFSDFSFQSYSRFRKKRNPVDAPKSLPPLHCKGNVCQ